MSNIIYRIREIRDRTPGIEIHVLEFWFWRVITIFLFLEFIVRICSKIL